MSKTEAMIREEALTRSFTASEALLFGNGNLSTNEHLTMVVDCEPEVRQNLVPYIEELRDADQAGCLSFTPLDNLHMTLQYPLGEDATATVRTVADSFLKERPFQLEIHGLHIRPQGISLACYSPAKELTDLRLALAEATGVSFDPTLRLANIGWITVARFLETPSEKIVAKTISYVDTFFGAMQVAGNVHVYRSRHRERIGAEKIW